jgi:hypothetical protein
MNQPYLPIIQHYICKSLLCLSICFIPLYSAFAAQEKILNADEIRKHLANTVYESTDGQWSQTFFADGKTVFRGKVRGLSSNGAWEAVTENGTALYCSIWTDNQQRQCYLMSLKGDVIIWTGTGAFKDDVYKAKLTQRFDTEG